ncbi:histidine phosphatase family protein [Marnyiella aurantia]|uniref:Histidine phosphatase family protein n=1 Tax=Marnyiella aurantia TaxID=2758037 RepID=A0A7D7LNQ2_9FLAO|nr:histidine phosphatase family protein [Marnyiella aurantia]MBA5247591.1 histidine phosphatase family protein [Marnyiella aurantia]QMS99342.1 histidine phosphatase family protein [Marnyiella aurantia]
MKKLLLIRHAKSDWPENTDDFDRPLAIRGQSDAQKMAQYLKGQEIEIEQWITSPAVRAKNTCEIFCNTFCKDFSTDEKLYQPSERNIMSVLYDLDSETSSVALFSHNNGISNFANTMTEDVFLFPTCGVAGFEVNCSSWLDFEAADKKLIFFYEPETI